MKTIISWIFFFNSKLKIGKIKTLNNQNFILLLFKKENQKPKKFNECSNFEKEIEILNEFLFQTIMEIKIKRNDDVTNQLENDMPNIKSYS